MMNESALVSIIIPTYNRAHLIGETIQSVVEQTYTNWELVIVDDGSEDNSEDVIKGFTDKRIRYFRSEHSGNISRVRNDGVRYAKGDFIAFLDSDDLWKSNKLELQLSLLLKYPRAAFIFSHGEQFGEGAIKPPPLEMLFVGNIFQAQLLEERFVLYPSTFLFKNEVLKHVEDFDESLSAGETDFFLRMAWIFEGVFTGERLTLIRKHNLNISTEREFIFCLENIKMIESFLKKGFLSQNEFITLASRQWYKLGLLYQIRGNHGKSSTAFLRYIKLKPLHYKGWTRLVQAIWLGLILRR
ncbi:MAG: hypothetical protein C0490_25550 [Marivirga sp.]|nr:hypothetical protein [Marivirga sp.]